MNRLGKLALSMDQTDMAQMAFQTCLRQNPNHFPAADGMLRVLCLREDFAEAYGWALTWYLRNANYKFGLDVILEIREKFDGFGLEYIERLWKHKFVDTHLKRTNMETVFPQYIISDPAPIEKPNLTGFHLDESNLSWLSVGQLIVDMYEHFQDTSAIGYDLTLDEWLGRHQDGGQATPNTESTTPKVRDVPLPVDPNCMAKSVEQLSEESQSKENSTDAAVASAFAIPPGVAGVIAAETNTSADVSGTEESDGGLAGSASSVAKPKVSRRRGGGDLVGLEQWGWHKNKRYTQRKKSLDKADPDATINGMLRKALPSYFE